MFQFNHVSFDNICSQNKQFFCFLTSALAKGSGDLVYISLKFNELMQFLQEISGSVFLVYEKATKLLYGKIFEMIGVVAFHLRHPSFLLELLKYFQRDMQVLEADFLLICLNMEDVVNQVINSLIQRVSVRQQMKNR